MYVHPLGRSQELQAHRLPLRAPRPVSRTAAPIGGEMSSNSEVGSNPLLGCVHRPDAAFEIRQLAQIPRIAVQCPSHNLLQPANMVAHTERSGRVVTKYPQQQSWKATIAADFGLRSRTMSADSGLLSLTRRASRSDHTQ